MGKATSRRSKERRGPVLDVLQELLAEGRNDQVVQLFEQLVAKNSELEKRLAEIGARRKKNEGISRDQLLLFLDALATAARARLERTRNVTRRISGCAARPVSMSKLSKAWGPKRFGSRERSRR